MPPYCSHHRVHHNDPRECQRMRNAEWAARRAEERRAKAELHARAALDQFAYVAGDRLSFQRALEVATAAALAALNAKGSAP